MTIRVDATAHSTVVRCSKCPGWHWAGGGGEKARGHREAELHEAAVHPGAHQAHDAAMKYAARNVHTEEPSSQRGYASHPRRDRMGDEPSRLLEGT